MHLVRADSVKHATSPSRRNTSRRVIHVASEFNFSPLLPNTEMSSAATPRTSVRLVQSGSTQVQPKSNPSPTQVQPKSNPLAGFAFLTPCLGPAPLPSFEAHVALKRNLDTGHPFSYCYESRTQHRLESVATRTPPPICASAQCSQTALALRTAKRREQFDRTRWLASDNHGISCLRRLFATVASLHVLTPKPSF
jgi:hypothetical protein